MANPLPPGVPPGFWQDFIKRYEADIADLQIQLTPLEDRTMHLHANGRDVTEHWITFLRQTIKKYENIIASVKRGELP